MFRCIGICSKCGKCKNEALMSDANQRKSKNMSYPADFFPETGKNGFGIAFDMGTTTVVGLLWNLETGKPEGSCAMSNPQGEFGADVISRIAFCGDDEEKLGLLRARMISCMNAIIEQLCREKFLTNNQIVKAAVCGNTTMSHIFAGFSPKSLALAPFKPVYTGALQLAAEKINLQIAPQSEVYLLPNIAGHVGGDITAGLLASRFMTEKQLTVFIDIGTNGEIALTDGKQYLACSTAAGPAFEGASIKWGMRAADGAIEKVRIEDGEVYIKTIGACMPVGICGSGIIDVVAQMRKWGLINKKGRILSAEDAAKAGISEKLTKRLETEGKERRFLLAESEDGKKISITQSDIREIQLAKGAIAAGIKLMLKEVGRSEADIEKIVVAGAFGNHIDKENAIGVGILPDVDLEKIVFAGNTAGAGTSMVLMSEKEKLAAELIPLSITHIELADKEDFQNTYMYSMLF